MDLPAPACPVMRALCPVPTKRRISSCSTVSALILLALKSTVYMCRFLTELFTKNCVKIKFLKELFVMRP